MSGSFALIMLIFCAAVLYVLWSAVAGWRSIVVVAVAIGLAVLCGGLATYAWTESKSLPWTIGYVTVAAGAPVAAAVGWVRGGKAAQ